MKTYDLNLLRALHELLDSGSVTVAADRMHLSVPAMSHTLARLRAVMADPLLVRAGRALVPTPRALELKEPVARLIAQAHALVAPAQGRSLADVARAFVLRAPDGVAVVFGSILATALEQVMPNSSLHVVPEAFGDVAALREGRIDLDFGSFRTRDPEVQTLELSRQPLVVAMHADAAPAGRLTVKRFAALRHVAVAPRPREVSALDQALELLGYRRKVLLTVPSAHAALISAARSTMAATVSERIATGMAPGLGLRIMPLPFDVTVEPMVMAWHPRHTADPAHAWLRGCVQRVLARPDLTAPPLRPWGTIEAAAR